MRRRYCSRLSPQSEPAEPDPTPGGQPLRERPARATDPRLPPCTRGPFRLNGNNRSQHRIGSDTGVAKPRPVSLGQPKQPPGKHRAFPDQPMKAKPTGMPRQHNISQPGLVERWGCNQHRLSLVDLRTHTLPSNPQPDMGEHSQTSGEQRIADPFRHINLFNLVHNHSLTLAQQHCFCPHQSIT